MKIQKIKLYHYPATRSARVKWVLHELLDDKFEVEIVPLYEGAQYKEDYLNKNPFHCVPTLEFTQADGEVIRMIESGAMLALLVDAFPEKKLAPPAHEISPQRIDYLQMLHFGVTTMDMMLWQIRVHTHLLPSAERDDRTVTRYREKFITEVEPLLKSRLEDAQFICGGEFSGADCVIAHNVMWARNYQMCADKVFKKYMLRVARRPAFRSAFSDANEFTVEIPEGKTTSNKFTG
ncbi:MAG: glutathione S-transferase family protein [Arenicellales bacterium]